MLIASSLVGSRMVLVLGTILLLFFLATSSLALSAEQQERVKHAAELHEDFMKTESKHSNVVDWASGSLNGQLVQSATAIENPQPDGPNSSSPDGFNDLFDGEHNERLYETDDFMTSITDWYSRSINEELQGVNAMERPPTLPTMAPLRGRCYTVGRLESILGTLSQIADVVFSEEFLVFVLTTAIFLYLLSKIVLYYKKILERLCHFLEKLQEVYQIEDRTDNDEDEKLDDELSVPEGCEEKIPDKKQDEITGEEKAFFVFIGRFLIFGFLLVFVLRTQGL